MSTSAPRGRRGFTLPVDRIGEMRVAAGNFAAPNFQKLTQPVGRLRAVRPEQSQAQEGPWSLQRRRADLHDASIPAPPYRNAAKQNSGRYSSSWMVFKRTISNSLIPAGVCTLTSSPTFCPRSAFPIGRGGRNQSQRDVRFLGADQLVFDLDGFLGVQHPDARAVSGAVGGNIIQVQHAEIAQALSSIGRGAPKHSPGAPWRT